MTDSCVQLSWGVHGGGGAKNGVCLFERVFYCVAQASLELIAILTP